MDLEKLTLKSQEAVSAAQQIAAQRSHQAVEPEHLLYALLSDPDGVVFPGTVVRTSLFARVVPPPGPVVERYSGVAWPGGGFSR